jgi:hypothetical protein
MALADTLGVNLVETFLAFITSDESQRRQVLGLYAMTRGWRGLIDETW